MTEQNNPALCLVLHGHLPWVNHPEYEHFLEEDWFFEGVADCYMPLLEMMNGWERDGLDASFTLDISPPLLSMMAHDPLKERVARYLEARKDLVTSWLEQADADSPFRAAAENARHICEQRVALYDGIDRDLPAAFRRHWDAGRVELMTCGATHGLLPVLLDEGSARAQIQEAIRTHTRILGRAPRGIWQPECGVTPSSFDLFAEAGLTFTFTEDRAVLFGAPPPAYSVSRPVYTAEGIAVFPRDPACGKEVWSADEGYPGEAYLDTDIGNNGGALRNDDVDIQVCTEGGHNIGWISNGEWLEYTVDVQQAGAYLLEARVSSPNTGGSFRMMRDGQDLTGPIAVPNSGGWQNWRTVSAPIQLQAGVQTLRFAVVNASGGFNLNWFRFTPDGGCSAADLAEPYGVLNFFDLAAYMGLFTAQDPAADLAAPFGVFNFFDVAAFLTAFNAGCP
jgi:hypothetical protein